jgi:tetratricopeptide (TPR) repeat protein
MKLNQIIPSTVKNKSAFIIVSFILLLGTFTNLKAQNNDKISTQYNEAIKLISEKEYELAKEKLSDLIRQKSDFAEAVFARGTCHLMLQERESACTDFEKAKQLNWAPANEYIEKFCGKDAYGRTIEKQKKSSE